MVIVGLGICTYVHMYVVRIPSNHYVIFVQVSTSLPQLFVKFLEVESSPSESSPPALTNPQTDPDKPFHSTASLLGQTVHQTTLLNPPPQ